MALCIVLLVMYGGFHISCWTKYDFLYQISWDCPLKDGDARIKQRQNRRTPLCVRWRISDDYGIILSFIWMKTKRKFHDLYQISWDCPLKDGESDAAEARCRADEAGGDDLRAEADSLEYLRPLVGLQGGDAHLRHHLHTKNRVTCSVPNPGSCAYAWVKIRHPDPGSGSGDEQPES